jgi:outer membrane murein-binding lipoprotein Lpp
MSGKRWMATAIVAGTALFGGGQAVPAIQQEHTPPPVAQLEDEVRTLSTRVAGLSAKVQYLEDQSDQQKAAMDSMEQELAQLRARMPDAGGP